MSITYSLTVYQKTDKKRSNTSRQRTYDIRRVAGVNALSHRKRWGAESAASAICDLWWVDRVVIDRVDRKEYRIFMGCHTPGCREHRQPKKAKS